MLFDYWELANQICSWNRGGRRELGRKCAATKDTGKMRRRRQRSQDVGRTYKFRGGADRRENTTCNREETSGGNTEATGRKKRNRVNADQVATKRIAIVHKHDSTLHAEGTQPVVRFNQSQTHLWWQSALTRPFSSRSSSDSTKYYWHHKRNKPPSGTPLTRLDLPLRGP
jgi:hypothetical protein